jgi:uncharacterized protein YfdQ (DUF2303 family)
LPDVESYYYVPKHQYVYLDGGQWVFRNTLPTRYSGYNINNGYKVAVNRPRAYRYYTTDRTRYAKYKGTHDRQVIVRDNYRTRVVNRPTRVVNRTHYVNKPGHYSHTKVVKVKHYKSNGHGNNGHGNNGHGKGKH